LEVLDSLVGGGCLLGVASGGVPAFGEDGGPDEGGEQDNQGAAVLACASVDEVTRGGSQTGGGVVFGADLGALGLGEGSCCGAEFGAQFGGSGLGGGFDQLAEGRDLGLATSGGAFAGAAGVVAEGVEGRGGVLPGGVGPVAAGGGVFRGGAALEAGAQFGEGEVGGDPAAGVELPRGILFGPRP
jgi:hypothetical protein